MTVWTAQINRYRGADALDITIKSAGPDGRPFAPDRWDMVLGVKQGRISPAQYEEYYTGLMRRSYRSHPDAWRRLLTREEVTLVCYCPRGVAYCHRVLLARILESLGATYAGGAPMKRTIRAIDTVRSVRLPMPARPSRPHTPKTVYRRRPKHRLRWEPEACSTRGRAHHLTEDARP